MAFYDQMVAGLSALVRDDAYPYSAKADKLTIKNSLTGLAPLASLGVCAEVLSGLASGTTELGMAADSVVVALAFVKASGAAAAKCLLAVTTDYTISGTTFTWASNQSLNNVLVLYIPTKSW